MKYLDEYRDEKIAHALAQEIRERVTRPWVLMEICGGQTHTIMRYGIDELLPKTVELVHGPGCPVCVTPLETIDKALELAARHDVTLVSYGDMLRVPGSSSDLFHAKANGSDVRVVYSPLEALKIARTNPGRKVIFLAIGFETTAPANAMAIWQAQREGLNNFSVLASHVLVPPAIRLLLGSSDNRVQGFIAPGHVCTVMGYRQYEELVSKFRVPIVVGGFEPVDLLEAILMLVRQLERGQAVTENQYVRSVTRDGNIPAQQIVETVFEVCDQKWRGIGTISQSGLRIRPAFSAHDAERIFGMCEMEVEEPTECISAQVLKGLKKPPDCPVFANRCTPESHMPFFRKPSREALWQDEFSIFTADESYVSRRQFTKFLTLASLGMFVGNLWIFLRSRFAKTAEFPSVVVARLGELPVDGVTLFAYPTPNDRCILIRTGEEEYNAYSQKCTHLSCAVYYEREGQRLACPCHQGFFSVKDGSVLQGPPPRPLPRILLERQGHELAAIGVRVG